MTQNNEVHPAAEALSYELGEWDQSPVECGWYFTATNSRLIAEKLDDDGYITATYSVALADIPFTHNTN